MGGPSSGGPVEGTPGAELTPKGPGFQEVFDANPGNPGVGTCWALLSSSSRCMCRAPEEQEHIQDHSQRKSVWSLPPPVLINMAVGSCFQRALLTWKRWAGF